MRRFVASAPPAKILDELLVPARPSRRSRRDLLAKAPSDRRAPGPIRPVTGASARKLPGCRMFHPTTWQRPVTGFGMHWNPGHEVVDVCHGGCCSQICQRMGQEHFFTTELTRPAQDDVQSDVAHLALVVLDQTVTSEMTCRNLGCLVVVWEDDGVPESP